MYKKISTFIIFFTMLIFQSAFAKPEEFICKYEMCMIAPGTVMKVILSQDINSNTAVTGQTIDAILNEDVKCNYVTVAPSGSVVSGNIVYNKKGKIVGQNPEIKVVFTTIIGPYNNVTPIDAIIKTSDSTGIIKGEEKSKAIKIPAGSTIEIELKQPITTHI